MLEELDFIMSFPNETEGIEKLRKKTTGIPIALQPILSTNHSLTQPITDFVIWCMFLKQTLPCMDYFSKVFTDGGLCATLNAQHHNGQGDILEVRQPGVCPSSIGF